jgi:hypothetical protein
MNDGYGHEVPAPHSLQQRRPVARYLVVIASGSESVARLMLADRTQVAEFDAGAEEVTDLTRNLAAQRGATDAAWDQALAGHSAAERAGAEVYTLEV